MHYIMSTWGGVKMEDVAHEESPGEVQVLHLAAEEGYAMGADGCVKVI